jgi:hypothetical protein
MMRFSARIAEKSTDPADPWVICELYGTNQDDQQILSGRCTLILPGHSLRDHEPKK